jgi:chorismate mutase/prephenate dehydratase
MTARTLYYLGPQGTFTHQAAVDAGHMLRPYAPQGFALAAAEEASEIIRMVQNGRGWGVIAWENNVEGYVVPNLDALIDANGVAGFARIGVGISFDAFTCRASLSGASAAAVANAMWGDAPQTRRNTAFVHGAKGDGKTVADSIADIPAHVEVSAHPHGLAQCRRFIAQHQLQPVPATSNAAACRDLQPGRIALGPAMCGPLYGLSTLATQVQDYQGARTEFLVLGARDDVPDLLAEARTQGVTEFESIIAFIPLSTGPGVLANLLDVLRDAGLNMSSFISRPIKGHDGTYSFIATIDAAPWQEPLRKALIQVVEHGDWAKTLAVYPRRERPNPPVDAWMLPTGGMRGVTVAAQDDDMPDVETQGGELHIDQSQNGAITMHRDTMRAETAETTESGETAHSVPPRTLAAVCAKGWQRNVAARRELLW